ncbi:MAG: tetratricopeptide repeat protein [Pseudomonadota bacterium]
MTSIARFCLTLSFLVVSASVTVADGLAGAYLSGRHAAAQNDYVGASNFYKRALNLDPESAQLQNDAILSFVMRGDMNSALDWVDQSAPRNTLDRLPRLLTLADALAAGNFDTAREYLSADDEVMSPIIKDLLSGWITFGQGSAAEAISEFDSMNGQGFGVLAQYHKALAFAATGNFEAAGELMAGGDRGPLHIDRNAIASHALILANTGDTLGAALILDQADPTGSDPKLSALRAELVAGNIPAFTVVRSATDGAAEVFRALSQILASEENTDAALIYARLAQHVRPGQSDVNLLLGDILRFQDQYIVAAEEYSKVAFDDPLYLEAEMSRADTLAEAGETEAAIAVLQGLERTAPGHPEVQITLGDILRFEERFAEAEPFYTAALDQMADGDGNLWRIYYARGIARERTDQWELAETDFRRSLDLSPNQPFVLNYLGYSLVEKGQNLEEALEMIKRAVSERPEDGYITDSLGWAYYRLGDYQKAVEPMERAASLVATDPIINDHLGDVYWMVGRKREARFQWRRALSFKPEEPEIPKIKRKLEIGLEAFLQEQSTAETVLGE